MYIYLYILYIYTHKHNEVSAPTWYLSRNTSGLLLYWWRSSSLRSSGVSSASPICWLFTWLPLRMMSSTMASTPPHAAWLLQQKQRHNQPNNKTDKQTHAAQRALTNIILLMQLLYFCIVYGADAGCLTWVSCRGRWVSRGGCWVTAGHPWDRVTGSSCGNSLWSSLSHRLGCILTGVSISPHIINSLTSLLTFVQKASAN